MRKFSMEWELVKKRKYSWKSPRKVNTEDEGVGGGQLAELRVFGAKSLIYWQSPLTCSLHSHAIISFLIILDNATVAKMSLIHFLKNFLSIAKITESPIYWKFLPLSLQFATFSCSNLDIASKNRNQKYRCTLQSRSTNGYTVVSTKQSNQPRVTVCKVPKLSRSAMVMWAQWAVN